MGIEKVVQLYSSLLEVYTEQVKGLEQQQQKLEKSQYIGSVPYKMLNSRMFIPNAYLTNSFNSGVCYNEKNIIMPHLIGFFAEFEKLSAEGKQKFENLKPANVYQNYLDELLVEHTPFKDFIVLQLNQYRMKESELHRNRPYPPQKRNATLQKAKYEKDMREYEIKLADVIKCIKESQSRIELFEKLFSQ